MQSSGKVVVKTKSNHEVLRWGKRKSAKLVRAYMKPEVTAFRIELELHSRLLRRELIRTLEDLHALPDVICPRHFQFIEIRWQELQLHIERKLGPFGIDVVKRARRKATSIPRLRRYLQRKGLVNIHRFLAPFAMNKDVEQAFRGWAKRFTKRAHAQTVKR